MASANRCFKRKSTTWAMVQQTFKSYWWSNDEGFSAFWEVLGCQSPLKDEPCSRNSSRPSTPHSVIDLSVTDNVHVIEPVSPVNNQSFINLHTQPTPASSHLVS